MATYQIIYWRDIPAQVKVKGQGRPVSRQLPERFERAIDRAATYAGAIGSDDYLAEWHKSDWQEREGEAETLLNNLVAEIETDYSEERLRKLARKGGYEQEEVAPDQD